MRRFAVVCFLCVFSIVGQYAVAKDYKIRKDSVTAAPLMFPLNSVDGVDFSDLVVEYAAMGEVTIGEPVVRQYKNPCGAQQVDTPTGTTWVSSKHDYYEIPYAGPKAVFVVKQASNGKVLAGDTLQIKGTIDFGITKCKARRAPGQLAQEYQAAIPDIRNDIIVKAEKELRAEVTKSSIHNYTFNYEPLKFKVYYVKSKARDYSPLNSAKEFAKKAYKAYAKNGINDASFSQLEAAVKIWQEALTHSNIKDEDAFINSEITMVIHRNLAVAYLFLLQHNDALTHDTKAVSLSKWNSVTHRSLIYKHQQRFKQSPNTSKKPADLAQLYNANNNLAKMSPVSQAEDQYAALHMGLDEHDEASKENDHKITLETLLDGPSGDSGWAAKVNYAGFNGHHIMMVGGWGARYSEIPQDVCDLVQLNELVVTHNDIAKIPDCIGNLTNLKKLDLSKNKLTSIPAGIGGLKNLKKLILSKNQITSLPDEIGQLKKLKKLVLKGNPISKDEIARIKLLLPKTKVKK